jgi:hypothetical protein
LGFPVVKIPLATFRNPDDKIDPLTVIVPVKVGEALRTVDPVPVDVVTPVPPDKTPSGAERDKLVAVAAPRLGETRVGDVFKTMLPLPVEVVTPVPPLATGNADPRVADEALNAPVIVKSPPGSKVIGVAYKTLLELYANQVNPPVPDPF